MFKFLGSLYFAIGLIGCTLVFVIAGTFLESKADSHLFAAHFTYENPVFQLLFWLYFINILFAALRRYPFQKKHIPFLLTHLGLLLLLLGVFVKNQFGVQGSMALAEGSGSSSIFLPNTYALQIENLTSSTVIELKPSKLGPLKTNTKDLQLTLLEWTPHVSEKLEGFIKGAWGHIAGLPPFEVKENAPSLQTPHYLIYAFQTDQYETPSFPGHASLFLIQDSQRKEHLAAFNEKGELFEQLIGTNAYYIYNKGYGGYAFFAELPAGFPSLELITPLTRTWQCEPIPTKREEAIPLIRLLAVSKDQTEIVTLAYDKYAQKLKWPVFGKYLVRFQPYKKTTPMHVRLRSAKQVNYPGSSQPYSYEASVLIDQEEAALSMNHVYEKNGYRFYLANLAASETGANHVQIVVNHDPAKYILTYPGAIILALGIILLYFQRRYV